MQLSHSNAAKSLRNVAAEDFQPGGLHEKSDAIGIISRT